MSGRVYERKFDWALARRLRKQGMTYKAIADRLGVSETAIFLACNPRAYNRVRAYGAEYARNGTCPDCGGPSSRNGRRNHRCRACANAAQATTVRDHELRCNTCGEWKPDGEFPYSRALDGSPRRGRNRICRACLTVLKRAYRERHKVPCKAGCGRLVLAPNELAAAAHARGSVPTGMCHSCSMRARRRKEREEPGR